MSNKITSWFKSEYKGEWWYLTNNGVDIDSILAEYDSELVSGGWSDGTVEAFRFQFVESLSKETPEERCKADLIQHTVEPLIRKTYVSNIARDVAIGIVKALSAPFLSPSLEYMYGYRFNDVTFLKAWNAAHPDQAIRCDEV